MAKKPKPTGERSAVKPKGLRPKKGVKVQAVSFTKGKDETKEGSWFDTLLVVFFAVQCCGRASVVDIVKYITESLKAKIRPGTASDAAKALQSQNMLAESTEAEGGTVYKTKKYRFNCGDREMAEVAQLLQTLRADSTGALILERLRNTGNGKDKKPWPKKPHHYQARVLLGCVWVGGHPWAGNTELQRAYFRAGKWHTMHVAEADRCNGAALDLTKKDHEVLEAFVGQSNTPLMFERRRGKIVAAHKAAVKGFLEKAISKICAPNEEVTHPDRVEFFGTKAIMIEPPESVLTIKKLPVQRGNTRGKEEKGAGVPYYEVLDAGTELIWEFSAPTENFITPQEMKRWLSFVLQFAERTMSPARGVQYGEALLISLHHKPALSGEDFVEI